MSGYPPFPENGYHDADSLEYSAHLLESEGVRLEPGIFYVPHAVLEHYGVDLLRKLND